MADVEAYLKVIMDNVERMSQTMTDVTKVLTFFSKSFPNEIAE